MKKYLCLLASLCLFITVSAQKGPQPLSIGDKLPDITIDNILNHPGGQTDLTDYRGSWLILDFWATWCSPCITMFPKTDSLEKVFEGKVRFLAVTYEKESEVTRLFSKMDFLKGLTPPIVVRDSLLRALFPHRSLPHYVWINPEGEVAAITGMKEVTAENINAVLLEKDADMAVKKDKIITFDRFDSLLTLNPLVSEKSVRFTSTLTGYVEGANSFTYSPQGRFLAMNRSLYSLYQRAYGAGKTYFGNNRTFVEVRETNNLKYSEYCFEVNIPAGVPANKYLIMQQVLKQCFPQYKATVEAREVKVLALIRTSDKDKIKSPGGKPFTDIKPYGAILRNRPLNHLMRHLIVKYLQLLPTPVVDRTGYRGKVDITLDADLSNVPALREALQEYDLDLVERMEEIEVLVIRDARKNQSR